jgi:hypothetical protein
VNHYEALQVPPTAPVAEIRRAYLRLARIHHPDHDGGDPERMRRLNAAWEVLGDPARRAAYDDQLAGSSRGGASERHVAHRTGSRLDGLEDFDDLEDFDGRDDLDGLDDDRPLGVSVPRWLAMAPVGLFAASVVVVAFASIVGVSAMLGAALVLFGSSVAMFLVTPFVALVMARHNERSGPPGAAG